MKDAKNILICGKPGVGKTTLIKKIARDLGKRASGFYTEEIREMGKRVGFKIKNLREREGILAHINSQSSYRVGRYKVNLNEFEKIALPSIKKGINEGKIIIIDEIGKMELYSKDFSVIVMEALRAPNTVIATIPVYKNKFLKKIRERDDTKILEITKENREKLYRDIKFKIASAYNEK